MFEDPFKWLLLLEAVEQPRIAMGRRHAEEEERKRKEEEEEEERETRQRVEEEREKKKRDSILTDKPRMTRQLEVVLPSPHDDDEEDRDEWDEDEDDEDGDEDEEGEVDEDGDEEGEVDEDGDEDEEREVDEDGDEDEERKDDPRNGINDSVEAKGDALVENRNTTEDESVDEPEPTLAELFERDKYLARCSEDEYQRFYRKFPDYRQRFPEALAFPDQTELDKSNEPISPIEFANHEFAVLSVMFANAQKTFLAVLTCIFSKLEVSKSAQWRELVDALNKIGDTEVLAKLDEKWRHVEYFFLCGHRRVFSIEGNWRDYCNIRYENRELVLPNTLERLLMNAFGDRYYPFGMPRFEVAVLIDSVLGVSSQVRFRLAQVKKLVPEFSGVDFDATLYPPQDLLEKIHVEAEKQLRK